ncbi:Uncharacterized protein ChrSV_2410 [Chromobacterium vaccinii]|nr:Uncharacterized protein ChrSW_2410 [Chromobacterium vaccinii]QND89867.1 Uncharacterized protein ChrSV_2410 [Chromobacterium vaccinii]
MIDIDAIIDSMGWSLDTDERADMRRLCRTALIIAAERSGGMAAEVKEIDGVLHVFWSRPAADGMKLFTHQECGPAGPEEWRALLGELAQYAPEGLCAPTALQGFAMRAARLLAVAPSPRRPVAQLTHNPRIIHCKFA